MYEVDLKHQLRKRKIICGNKAYKLFKYEHKCFAKSYMSCLPLTSMVPKVEMMLYKGIERYSLLQDTKNKEVTCFVKTFVMLNTFMAKLHHSHGIVRKIVKSLDYTELKQYSSS